MSEKVHIPKPTAPRCHPAKAELAQRRVDPHPVTMEPIPEGTVLENGPEKNSGVGSNLIANLLCPIVSISRLKFHTPETAKTVLKIQASEERYVRMPKRFMISSCCGVNIPVSLRLCRLTSEYISANNQQTKRRHLLTTPAAPAGFPRSIQKLPGTILDTSHEEITRWRFQEPVVGMIFPTHTGILSIKGALIAMIHGPW